MDHGGTAEPWGSIAHERRRLADLFATLTPQQWATPSLCGAWTVRDVAAHLVAPLGPTVPTLARFAVDLVRARGSFDRANQLGTAHVARRPTEQLVADLRRAAGSRFVAPSMPDVASLAEVLVHGQDVRVPLGVHDRGDPAVWATTMPFLLSPAARRGFVPRGLPALTWTASDAELPAAGGVRAGEDAGAAGAVAGEVTGPVAALALAVMGRDALVGELTGSGVPALRAWLAGLD